MADDPKKFDFTKSVNRLEEINIWFQNEDFNLDEGLQKLKEGKDLIKKLKGRLSEVENEFVKIKQEFITEGQEQEEETLQRSASDNGKTHRVFNGQAEEPDEAPF